MAIRNQGFCIGGVKMKQLVMKDIRLLKTINLIIFCAGIFSGYAGVDTVDIYKSKVIYGFAIFIMIYMITIFSTQHEVKTKVDMMLNSFPVNRYDIVRAKYISMGFYILAISGIVFLSSNLFKAVSNNEMMCNSATIFDILFITGFALIFFAIYLPFQYYSIGKAQVFNGIFYAILIILPNIISRYGSKIVDTDIFGRIISMDLKIIALMFVGIGIMMYLVSLQISKGIYKAKEFY